MPFWNNEKTENYRAKLERKMCFARDTPEPFFDLADCNLSEVPSGVYSMCRVFLKEVLSLENNRLTSLQNGGTLTDLKNLMVLNLQNNRLSSLPNDIHYLINLQELNVENNLLKKLPDTFSKLLNLRTLNLKGNKLIDFPSPLCTILSLESLNVCDNPKIKILPKSLSNLVLLKDLQIDVQSMVYPSTDICSAGTEYIMKYLCSESGKDYVLPENTLIDHEQETENASSCVDSPDLSASYKLYQKAKLQRQQDMLLIEETLKMNQDIQSDSVAVANLKRQKLLEDIAQEQERMENEILVLQNRKKKERELLLDVLCKVEDHSAKLISQLMALNARTNKLDKILTNLEQDRLENEEIFQVKQEKLEKLCKQGIVEAMTQQLQSKNQQILYQREKSNICAQLQNEENENNLKLLNLFQNREADQQILLNALLEEEKLQKQAFETLQLQKDLQHKEIAQQIHLIEKELSSLTKAEIKKKDLKLSSGINKLSEHRTALAFLLTDLLAAKQKRENELKERLNQMEQQRLDEMEDFWLIQYQKLMDRKPLSVMDAESKIDPLVRCILENANALDFLPVFAIKDVTLQDLANYSISDIKKIGILDEDVCKSILDLTWKFLNSETEEKLPRFDDFGPTPSAPLEEEFEMLYPTAPLPSPDSDKKLWCHAECVICLDAQSSSVFLPCGHVCCCRTCYVSLEHCPMCRTTIESTFPLTFCD